MWPGNGKNAMMNDNLNVCLPSVQCLVFISFEPHDG